MLSIVDRVCASSILLVALLSAGCGGKAPEGQKPGPAANKPSDTIIIGQYASLTGTEATYGQSTHNGAMMAVNERNATGGVKGHKIELKFYDDKGEPAEAASAVTRLITQDKVVALIGGDGSSSSMAGGKVAQQLGVPMVTPSSTNSEVTRIGDMVFRVCFVDTFQGYVAARFARDQLNVNKVATLYDGSQAYSKGLSEEFEKQFSRLGGNVVTAQAYTGGDQDFATQLAAIREAKPEAVFVPGYYTDVGKVALQARRLGITAPLLGADGWDSAQLAAIAGDAVEGSYFISHYTTTDPRPEVQAFVKRYQARYSGMPDALVALGYDATQLLLDAMDRAPTTDSRAIANALAHTKDFAGVTGHITIDPERNAQKQAVIVQMKAGQPIYKIDIDPPEAAMLDAAPADAPAAPPVEVPAAGKPAAGFPNGLPAGFPPGTPAGRKPAPVQAPAKK